MHIKAAFFIWSLFSLWQRDVDDNGSRSYQLGKLVGQIVGVLLVVVIVLVVYKKMKK